MELVNALIGYPGDWADENSRSNYSRTLVSSEEIPMGRLVRVLENGKIALPQSASDDFRGASRSHADADIGQTVYPVAMEIEVACKGPVFMDADGPIKSSDPVFVRFRIDRHVVQIEFDADFVTDNVLQGGIGSETIDLIEHEGDQLATIREFANAISNLSEVGETVVVDNRTIRFTSKEEGHQMLASFFVSGGATQATASITTVSGPSSGTKLGGVRADDDDTGTGPAAVQISQMKCLKSGGEKIAPIIDLNMP